MLDVEEVGSRKMKMGEGGGSRERIAGARTYRNPTAQAPTNGKTYEG